MTVLREAANILDISEYDVLHHAYHHWHGKSATAKQINRTFSDYLKTQQLPHWARHYAVEIIQRFEAELNLNCKCFGSLFQLLWGFNLRPANKSSLLLA